MVQYSQNHKMQPGEVGVIFQSSTAHAELMLGLISTLRLAILNDDKRDSDVCGMAYVCDFLYSIIPDEYQLSAGIQEELAEVTKKCK